MTSLISDEQRDDIEQLYAAFDRRDVEAVVEGLAPDGVVHRTRAPRRTVVVVVQRAGVVPTGD